MKKTPKQLAQATGVSQSTIYSLVRQGKLAAYRVGCRGRGKYLIEEADWERFLAGCRTDVVVPESDDGFVYLKLKE